MKHDNKSTKPKTKSVHGICKCTLKRITRFHCKFHHHYIVLLLTLQAFLPGIPADSRSDICRQGRCIELHYDTAATGTHRRPGRSSCPRSQADIHSGVTDPRFGTSRHWGRPCPCQHLQHHTNQHCVRILHIYFKMPKEVLQQNLLSKKVLSLYHYVLPTVYPFNKSFSPYTFSSSNRVTSWTRIISWIICSLVFNPAGWANSTTGQNPRVSGLCLCVNQGGPNHNWDAEDV